MRWFWYSLIGFCLLMCGCRTKKNVSEVDASARYSGDARFSGHLDYEDMAASARVDIDKSRLKITETIKVTEYDAESGKPIKETETERTTTQDTDKVVSTSEEKEVAEKKDVLVKHVGDFSKTMKSEKNIESIGGQESFGKWMGIVLGLGIVVLIAYLWRKISRLVKP